mgnify:CR=1 FL=1
MIGAMLLIWVAVIAVAVWAVGRVLPDGGLSDRTLDSSRALDILMRRYAQGEIEREEYERMTRDIEEDLGR